MHVPMSELCDLHLRAQVAWTEDVMYFPWYEKCFEFRWDVCSSVWDVEIANAQD